MSAWPLYALFAALSVGVGVWVYLGLRRAKQELAEFVAPPGPVTLAVGVRGADSATLARFARCWELAFRCLVANGPWTKEQLIERLGPGSRVQVRSSNQWRDGFNTLVGGQLIAGVIHIGPDLSALAHELAHRALALIDHDSDNAHATWKARGLEAADQAYRAALKRL